MSTLRNYLGKSASALLEILPYSSWEFERTVDGDLPDYPIDYVCEEEGFSINCDGDDRIRSIFLTSANLIHKELDLPLQCERRDVLGSFGLPSKSGEPSTHQILGKYGAWDRYDGKYHSLHIEYLPDIDRIKMVTLIRCDAVPGQQ
jgi:hypothetical protein